MNEVRDTTSGPWYCVAYRDTSGWNWSGVPQKRTILLSKASYLLDMTAPVGGDEYRVLGASSERRLEDMLRLLKEKKPTIALSLKGFVEGTVPDRCIPSWEYVLIKEGFLENERNTEQNMRKAMSAFYWVPSTLPNPLTESAERANQAEQVQHRLEFYRWLYERGRLTEEIDCAGSCQN